MEFFSVFFHTPFYDGLRLGDLTVSFVGQNSSLKNSLKSRGSKFITTASCRYIFKTSM